MRRILESQRAAMLIVLIVIAACLCTIASAASIKEFEILTNRRATPKLKVTAGASNNMVTDGKATYVGACSGASCYWRGVRYAKPPTGVFRFAPAQTLGTSDVTGIIAATQYGSKCLQSGAGNEDCLFLNIQRPSNVALSTKLPVLIFVHGGGFQSGSGADQDTSALVAAGSTANLPTVVVTINYRLGLFGFLGGSTFNTRQKANQKDVAQNAAFTDVREAVSWVSKHIGAFGGDATKITLWGQSAGSFASAAQLLGSASKPPFAGVILESGSAGGVPIDPPAQKNSQFNAVVSSAGCSGASDQIACLRGVSATQLQSISVSQSQLNNNEATIPRGYYAWTPTRDGGPSRGGFFSDRPSVVIASGAFANVPIIHGDCLDEGTYFARQDSNSDADTSDFIGKIWFDQSSQGLLNTFLQQYPDIPAQGSPYQPQSGDYNTRYYTGTDNQYKRIASMYGDIRFQANRRLLLNAFAKKGTRAYSYIFAQPSGVSDARGYPHGSDQAFIFNTAANNPFGDALARQWLSFAAYQTPNKAGTDVPHWYQYTTSKQTNFYYANSTLGQLDDNFRSSGINFLNRADVLSATGR